MISILQENLDSSKTFGLTIIVTPHTKNVNVSYRMYFEVMESFGLIICEVN